MVITCDDLIFNDFRMSDYEIVSGNGSNGEIDDTENMGMVPSVTKVFNGENPFSSYISYKYDSNPQFTVKFMKSYCSNHDNDHFTENELRMFNRLLTGKAGYSWLKIINSSSMETDYWYPAYVAAIEYERLGLHVVGYDVTFELDGGMAYSEEQRIKINATANTPFVIHCNSDDLYGYTLPKIIITLDSSGSLSLTNNTDGWTTTMSEVYQGETITFDTKRELLSSTTTRVYILNSFNLHWPRLLPGRNEYVCNKNCTIEFVFRTARKVGFVS